MRDLIFVALTIGFFGVARAFVTACDRIIGPDPAPVAETKEAVSA